MASNGLWAITRAPDVPAELLFLVAAVLVAIGVGLFLRGDGRTGSARGNGFRPGGGEAMGSGDGTDASSSLRRNVMPRHGPADGYRHLSMNFSTSTTTRVTLPAAMRPRSSDADTAKVSRRPSILSSRASAVTR
jgi:hypothetical protein